MTLALRPIDLAPARDASLAARRPDIPARAYASFIGVSEELPGVWPPTPDEERVRYYAWASRHVRECSEALFAAWELLEHVAFWMDTFAEQLDEFRETGLVPAVDDADLAPREDDVIERILAETRVVARAPDVHTTVDDHRPRLRVPAVTRRSPTARALPAPTQKSNPARPCAYCGKSMGTKVRLTRMYCDDRCRLDARHVRRYGHAP